jgi:hypothetical protein
MVYGIDNHGLPYPPPQSSCIRRENNNLNVGITCENFNSTNLIHSQISTTTQSPRKRNSTTVISADGCNIDLSGLTREERRSKGIFLLVIFLIILNF